MIMSALADGKALEGFWTSYSEFRWRRRRSGWRLVEGEDADGVIIEEDSFRLARDTATTCRPIR